MTMRTLRLGAKCCECGEEFETGDLVIVLAGAYAHQECTESFAVLIAHAPSDLAAYRKLA